MFRPLLKIGNYECPTPSEYVCTTATLVDGGRNALGSQIGAVIREVAKVEASWNYLRPEAWANILKQFTESYGGKFYAQVTYYDQEVCDWKTTTMYCGDRKTGGAFMLDSNGRPKGWRKCELHLVEQ